MTTDEAVIDGQQRCKRPRFAMPLTAFRNPKGHVLHLNGPLKRRAEAVGTLKDGGF